MKCLDTLDPHLFRVCLQRKIVFWLPITAHAAPGDGNYCAVVRSRRCLPAGVRAADLHLLATRLRDGGPPAGPPARARQLHAHEAAAAPPHPLRGRAHFSATSRVPGTYMKYNLEPRCSTGQRAGRAHATAAAQDQACDLIGVRSCDVSYLQGRACKLSVGHDPAALDSGARMEQLVRPHHCDSEYATLDSR